MRSIFVVGASGVLGHAAAEYFLGKGFRVTAMVRDPARINDLAAHGARVVKGDLTAPSAFATALQGEDVVLTAAHALMGKGKNRSEDVDLKGHKSLIDAAKEGGVRHFIYTSVEMASPESPLDFSRTKYAIEQYLANSGISYTIIRPTAFMEWHAYKLLGQKILENGKVSILGNGQDRVNFIAVCDVVAAIEKIIGDDEFRNKIIELNGPDSLNRNEVAERFGKAFGRPYKVGHVPIGVVRFLRTVMKPFHPGLARVMDLTIHSEGKDSPAIPGNTIAKFGLKPTTMNDFIQSVNRKS